MKNQAILCRCGINLRTTLAFDQAGLAGVERALKKRSLEVTGKGTVERNTIEVKKAVDTLVAAKPQAIVMISAYKSCAAFIRDMKKAGYNSTFWNVSFVGSKALAKELGTEGRGVQISQVVPFPWDNSVPVVKEYRRLLDDARGEPGFGTLEGFIAAKVTVEGLRRAVGQAPRELHLLAEPGILRDPHRSDSGVQGRRGEGTRGSGSCRCAV